MTEDWLRLLKASTETNPPPETEESEKRYADEKQELEIKRLAEELDALKAINQNARDFHGWQKYGLVALLVVCIFWLSSILFFVWMVASRSDVTIADSVLIALIGTTTVNVLGLCYVAAKWLYPRV